LNKIYFLNLTLQKFSKKNQMKEENFVGKKKEGWPKKDGMGCTNYQLNSFHPKELRIALSTFFADGYVNRYAAKMIVLFPPYIH
jgi:hypothetical protein